MSEDTFLITDKGQMRLWSRSKKSTGKTIALVPTMGCLHEGHLTLIREAKRLAPITVVSIYVNPGQFSLSEDFSTYPSDLDGDLKKLRGIGVGAVFCPLNLYYDANDTEDKNGDRGFGGSGHETWVRVEKLEKGLCGRSRPMFFRGVATVVAKLFNIVEPDIAFFGKKDYQQWRVVERMVRDLDFDIKILGLEILRNADGLALSSRNIYLTPVEREKALTIFKSLSQAKIAAQNGERSAKILISSIIQAIVEAGGKVDYVEIVDQENLEAVEVIRCPVVCCVAAWFGKARLIDNIEIYI